MVIRPYSVRITMGVITPGKRVAKAIKFRGFVNNDKRYNQNDKNSKSRKIFGKTFHVFMLKGDYSP